MNRRNLKNLASMAVRTSILLVALCISLFAQGKNPIILVPGLSGSELVNKNTGERIWFKTFRSKSEDLRLPVSTELSKSRDSIVPGDILRGVKIGPIPVTDIYGGFIQTMEVRGGYYEETWEAPSEQGYHDSLYVFAYDWRLDNVLNAQRLIRSVEALKKKLKKPKLKFDIVAHSMGGIISRYAIMYGDDDLPAGNRKPTPTWAGSKHFDKVILMGTPNEGSVSSLGAMVNGFTIGGLRIDLPFVQDTSKFTVFTIPTSYELLPAPGTLRAFDENLEPLDIDIYDPQTWSKYGWNPIDDKDFVKEFSPTERRAAPAFFTAQLSRAKRLSEALTAAPGKSVGVTFFVVGSDCRAAADAIVVYHERNSEEWKTLFRPRSFTRSDGVKVSEDEVKKVMYAMGDGVVTTRSLEAVTQSKAAGIVSILDGGSGKFICEDHNKLAANSRIQDYIIGVLDGKEKAGR
ncbi:MAG: hypothetical protein WBO10_00540 [Pyrinomonadaceae bacterium]